MAIKSRAYFKARFIQGYTLTAQDYADWLDSYWHQQDTLPAGDGGPPVTTLPASSITLADAANNFDTDNVESALVQLYNALQQVGGGGGGSTNQNANQVPVADAAEVFTGTDVEAVLLELYTLANNGGGGGSSSTETKRALLTTSGITVDVEYIGSSVPVLSGSGGNYTLSILSGTSWLNAYVEALDSTQATASNNFSFTVANANTDLVNGSQVARKDRCIVQLTNLDTGQIVEDLGEFGIDRNQTSNASGQVTNQYAGVGGAFDGFAAFFTR